MHQPGSHMRKAKRYFSTFLFAVLTFIFIASKIRPSLSLVDREVEFCAPTIFFLFFSEEKYQFEWQSMLAFSNKSHVRPIGLNVLMD